MQEVSKITQDHFVKMPFPAGPIADILLARSVLVLVFFVLFFANSINKIKVVQLPHQTCSTNQSFSTNQNFSINQS